MKLKGLCVGVFCIAHLWLPAQEQRFTGSVKAGESYVHDLGRGLALVVTTSSIAIQAFPLHEGGHDFIGCVTPPYHGPHATEIQAAQFVDEQNQPLTGVELEDSRARDFKFTLSAGDDKAACENLETASRNPPRILADGTLVYGTPGYQFPPLGSGRVRLLEIKLSSLGPGKHAEIRSLSFEASIRLPPVKSEAPQ
jgi:hypothetical protein